MQPTYQPPQPINDLESTRRANKKLLIWGLVCLVGPTALFVISIVLYAIVHVILSANAPVSAPSSVDTPAPLFTDAPSPITTITNIVLFLIGTIGTIAWLPGIIVGIILLAKRKKI